MTPVEFVSQVLTPGLAFIRANLPKQIPASVSEAVMLTAIAGQESNWSALQQRPVDFANSYWQFERGGILALMRDDETSRSVAVICGMAGIAFQSTAIWRFMGTAGGDNFSCAMARLLLWSDPMPLPAVGAEEASYRYYLRNWRPGAPSRERWSVVYPQATDAMKGQTP